MISLIIPTYNCIDFLDETLDSVLSQLPEDDELIIVDDGSSDGTAQKLAEFRSKAKDNIRILLREHKGVSSARNSGIDAASGEWIAFMDCDDCLMDGFFEKSRPLLKEPADLYVFSFERVEPGKAMPFLVADRFFENASSFADEYIRNRHLLVYSACNKIYRKALLEEHGIRFREGLSFGEDRLFNYDYLPAAGGILTSSILMFKYMQRNPESASNRVFPDYFNTIMMLHEAKMDCFLNLSRGTSPEEKKAFAEYDFDTEMKRMPFRPVDYHDYIGRRVHMIGIGGSSMSGLAVMLQQKGCIVTGSDIADGERLRELNRQGIRTVVGHSADNLAGADLVVYSAAIPEDQPELVSCREKGIPNIERSVLLGQLASDYSSSIAVCGTHGKTTVTSMISQILEEAGVDPTIHIGGVLDIIGGSTKVGEGDVFVTEACEYRRSFMNLRPSIVVLLNIDEDHLDYYRDIVEIESAFGDFLRMVPEDGWALVNGDDERVMRQIRWVKCRVSSFGTSENCDYVMSGMTEDEEGRFRFDILYRGEFLGHVEMNIPGRFNAMNALAAAAAAHHLGLDMEEVCRIMARFVNARGRFEQTGVFKGAEVFRDYGHNPEEMRNAISIARKRCRGGRLWAVMQPHTYSRVKALFEEYLDCTEEADVTLVTDIFGAREVDPGDIDSQMLVNAMRERGHDARLTPAFRDVEELLEKELAPGDLVITLGCGNIYKLNDILKEKASQ